MDDQTNRLEALRLACGHQGSPTDIVDRATAYYGFLSGAAAGAIATADVTEAPRLDSPEVQQAAAETLAAAGSSPEPTPQPDPTSVVTEAPAVTGDAGSATSSSANVGSASPQAQPSADAPAAAPSPTGAIDLAKVQAAVIATNKALGYDKAVEILKQHGGDRLPKVPVENHRALFGAMNKALAEAGQPQVAE